MYFCIFRISSAYLFNLATKLAQSRGKIIFSTKEFHLLCVACDHNITYSLPFGFPFQVPVFYCATLYTSLYIGANYFTFTLNHLFGTEVLVNETVPVPSSYFVPSPRVKIVL